MKYLYILSINLMLFFLASCQSDLLDKNPNDTLTGGNMWVNESLADQGVNGIYAALRQDHIGRDISAIESLGTTSNLIWSYGYNHILIDGILPDNGYFYNVWAQHYEIISRANDAVSHLSQAPLSESKYSRLMSESKFLRAYAYTRLNTLFKGVPVYLEYTEWDQFTKGRESAEKVWEVIINDLTDCINDPHLPLKYAAGDSNYGRVTKGAAYALRGKAYMWLKKWREAELDFVEVEKAGYRLFEGNYSDLFTEINEQSPEMIFGLQSMNEIGFGNVLTKMYGNRSSEGRCIDEVCPNTNFVETYQWADGSPFNWDDVIPGYNNMEPAKRKVFFLRNNLSQADIDKFTKEGLNMNLYLPTGNEERIRKAYENRDPRLEQTVITPYAEYVGSNGKVPLYVTLRYPYKTDQAEPFDINTNANTSLYYLFRKFVGVGVNPYKDRDDNPIDISFIRYADVLLNLAEALNEQNKLAEAIVEVNKVRKRAGVSELNSSPATQVKGKEDLMERIKMERRWELCGEAQALYDDMRWGAESYKKSKFFKGSGCKQVWGVITQFETKWSDKVMRWPIHTSELQKNSNLVQSEGW